MSQKKFKSKKKKRKKGENSWILRVPEGEMRDDYQINKNISKNWRTWVFRLKGPSKCLPPSPPHGKSRHIIAKVQITKRKRQRHRPREKKRDRVFCMGIRLVWDLSTAVLEARKQRKKHLWSPEEKFNLEVAIKRSIRYEGRTKKSKHFKTSKSMHLFSEGYLRICSTKTKK